MCVSARVRAGVRVSVRVCVCESKRESLSKEVWVKVRETVRVLVYV